MSWSVNFIGTPENVSKALTENSEKLTGVSKQEFDAALPHINALVLQNVNNDYPMVITLTASGHGYNGNNNCLVSIGNCGCQLV